MGREAEAQICFRGVSGPGKLLLEGPQILCRGAVRAKIDRGAITAIDIEGDDLILTTDQGRLIATLGAGQAAAWARALAKPLPTLAEKLGVHAGALALVVGEIRDPVLGPALARWRAPDASQARMAIAEVRGQGDLARALLLIEDLPFWAVTVKGTASPLTDAAVRTALCATHVDTKSCAISPQMTATRWQRRRV